MRADRCASLNPELGAAEAFLRPGWGVDLTAEAPPGTKHAFAADTTDDGGSTTTIATAYDYWWMRAFVDDITDQVSAPADRDELDRRIAVIGIDPVKISDGTIQRAVAAVLTT